MQTRVVVVGGFLGAGKTTLLMQAARQLIAQGFRVGIVTNDQGQNLVDTALIRAGDFPVTEVSGGCFCCNFPDLIQALTRLRNEVSPDIILAEPVGSCTDLVATTLRPLAAYHPDAFWVAPLTILIDPQRDLSVFPIEVDYLFKKQVSEASFILLSKSDLLAPEMRREYLQQLAQSYPSAQASEISALTGNGVLAWLEQILQLPNAAPRTMELDYQLYAEAEAVLGWLNANGRIHAEVSFSLLDWTGALLERIAQVCEARKMPIAHVKVQVSAGDWVCKASSVGSKSPVEWSLRPSNTFGQSLEFILNARVNSSPAALEEVVINSIEALKPDAHARYYFTHFECFSPSPPRPTYRLNYLNSA